MCYLFLLGLFLQYSAGDILNRTVISPANYSVPYQGVLDSSIMYIYEFSNVHPSIKNRGPPRVTVLTKNATIQNPLMVTTRQPKELLSWKLPLTVETESGEENYMNTSQTLCYDILSGSKVTTYKEIENNNPIISLATSSKESVDFTVTVDFPKYFHLNHNTEYPINISPSAPQYFFYNFSSSSNLLNLRASESNYDTVILQVNSEDHICTIVSIQNVSCPVFDLNQDITFRGFYETFTTKGGITIPKYKFPYGFYIVFVAKADDYDCSKDITPSVHGDRTKKLYLTIKPSITYDDYVFAVILTFCCIGGFYIVFGLFFLFLKRYNVPRQMQYAVDNDATTSLNSRILRIASQSRIERTEDSANLDSQSLDETEYDRLEEIDNDREIRLCRSQPVLSDLARKSPKELAKNSYLYLYNVLTVALFYGLPVVQLVITYQKVLNDTGEQDLCYYNFLCAHPLGFLSDFNHVFSNIGYILLGILFLFITYNRELTHKDQDFDRQYGIPQHYGLFYAMGVALMMEGVLSSSYHVCPSQTNFQFDSSFMYVMAVLCMIKLYQNRHPDINANAYSTFGVLAVAIVLSMIGLFQNTEQFWIFFVALHVLTCFYLSIKVYYMGCWKLSAVSLQRLGYVIRHDFWAGPINILKPCYKARFVMLLIGNLCNYALATYALTYHPKNFAVFLLLVFMSNTLLYFLFYIIMKYLHKEIVKVVTWIFLFISVLCAITAMYFFLHKTISWSQTPAQSRTFSMECKLLRFYDYHDIWHFLSAIGMFFTFMVLLTMDDDLSHTHHDLIPVF
ncbi:SID1 transmembrane family member 1-like isoform X2 [Euwallacea fornicatus]|uniref:SID1 transmembrane family member 1-like isoform X2 n=1 Tax=Euwallacea fornicatus TaxID=995702 RepID=UPI00338D8ACB